MKVPNVEYHIVYREGPEATVARRGYQQVHLPRIAVFLTYEEARLYMQMVAMMDRHILGKGKNGSYRVLALPFDLPPNQFDPILEEGDDEAWKSDSFPYDAMFVSPLRFDGFGKEKSWCSLRFMGFETNTEREFSERLCAELTPEFRCGDLVLLRGWDYQPDSYAVITALGTQGEFVQNLEGGDTWNGWYDFVFIYGSGMLGSDYAHVAWDFEMLPVADDLPPEFRVLTLLSRHYKAESPIPSDLYLRLTEELVLAEDMDVFPFRLFEEIDSASCVPSSPKERKRIMAPAVMPTDATTGEISNGKVRPELETVFVVFALDMDFSLGKHSVDAYDLAGSPAVFSSIERAKEHLSFLCTLSKDEECNRKWELVRQSYSNRLPLDVDPSMYVPCRVRVQIVEMLMPCETITDKDLVQSLAFEELVKHTWCYNVDEMLLWESPAPKVPNFERYVFEGRFNLGDLVYVVPQGIDPESESIMGGVAVVSEVPVSKDTWLASGQQPASWNPFYTVDFVDGNYYLQHFHVPESSLLLVDFPVLEDQAFLPLWSKHLRGELAFPEGLVDRIRARTVLLRKCPRYDFDTGRIVD